MEYEKYINTLARMKAYIAADHEHVNTAWDELYGYIHSVFPVPETAYTDEEISLRKMSRERRELIEEHLETQDIVVMFAQSEQEIIEKISSIPPVILETTFPVWIARYLLLFCRLDVNPSKLTTFDEFHRRYGPMIITASDRRNRT